jgi:hypothetical protein
MNPKEYMFTQFSMVKIGRDVEALDLDSFSMTLEQIEKDAPRLSPELFDKAKENIAAMRVLVERFKALKASMAVLKEAALKTSMAPMVKAPECNKPIA